MDLSAEQEALRETVAALAADLYEPQAASWDAERTPFPDTERRRLAELGYMGMGLPPELRTNIERADFAAGHMMYVEQSLLPQWKETLDDFILRTSGASVPVSD